MSKSAYIRVRMEPELKMQAETIFKEFGVTPTQVITMLYKQVLRNHEIPQEIARAIEEAKKGDGLGWLSGDDKITTEHGEGTRT